MNASLLRLFNEKLQCTPLEVKPLAGGDICEAYKVTTNKEIYFVKMLDHLEAEAMLKAELDGLKHIDNQKIIPVPVVIGVFELSTNVWCLVLNYLEPAAPTKKQHIQLGINLGLLHTKTHSNGFGYGYSNYLGYLLQSNEFYLDFSSFFSNQRLIPQFKKAFDEGWFGLSKSKQLDVLMSKLDTYIPKEPSALIHGDLWSGNCLYTTRGVYLIDVAVSYSHREQDLAMMHLFGGYDEVFRSYNESYPLENEWKSRLDIYQLYYLLAHVNLFGASYCASVERILEKYS